MEKSGNKALIRPIEVDDIDDVLAIDRKIRGTQRAITYGVEHLIGGKFSLSFIAEIDDNIVGFVLASLISVPEEVMELCAIQTIGIDPKFMHQGIATELIQNLLNESQSQGIKKTHVMIDSSDNQLMGFFENMEFKRGRLIELYKNV